MIDLQTLPDQRTVDQLTDALDDWLIARRDGLEPERDVLVTLGAFGERLGPALTRLEGGAPVWEVAADLLLPELSVDPADDHQLADVLEQVCRWTEQSEVERDGWRGAVARVIAALIAVRPEDQQPLGSYLGQYYTTVEPAVIRIREARRRATAGPLQPFWTWFTVGEGRRIDERGHRRGAVLGAIRRAGAGPPAEAGPDAVEAWLRSVGASTVAVQLIRAAGRQWQDERPAA